MADNTIFDKHLFCYKAFKEESVRSNYLNLQIFVNNVNDNRESNFDIVENRLGYLLIHGLNIISIVEKSIHEFLNHCSETEKEFLRKKVNICSLSSGPGLDIVGYLSALYLCKINLADAPTFTAINVNQSWQDTYQWVISSIYHEFDPSFKGNITFFSDDIYAWKDLNINLVDCDILLMINVFNSSKATLEVIHSTMTTIFTSIKRGSLVYLIGSKKCLDRILKFSLLFNFITVKYGPVNVSLQELPLNDFVIKETDFMPIVSKHAYFAVFQRKLDLPISKKRRVKQKNKQILKNTSSPLSCDASLTETIKNEEDSLVLSSSSISPTDLDENIPSGCSLSSSIPLDASAVVSESNSLVNLEKVSSQENHEKHSLMNTPSGLLDSRMKLSSESLLESDNDSIYNDIVQNLIDKQIENVELEFKTLNQLPEVHHIDHSVQESYVCRMRGSKSIDTVDSAVKYLSSNLKNIQADNTKEKQSPDLTDPTVAVQHQGVLKSQDAIFIIKKCENLIDAVKRLVESICDNFEILNGERKYPDTQRCCSENFFSQSVCRNCSQSCCQRRQSFAQVPFLKKSCCCGYPSHNEIDSCSKISSCSTKATCSALCSCSQYNPPCCQNIAPHCLRSSYRNLVPDTEVVCPSCNTLKSGLQDSQICYKDPQQHIQDLKSCKDP